MPPNAAKMNQARNRIAQTARGIETLETRKSDARHAGADSFLVNGIQCHHAHTMRKLRGLLNLVRAGRAVRVGPFDLNSG